MNTKNDKPARLMEWKTKSALGFNISRGYIKEGVKPKDVTKNVKSYNEFMSEMQEAFEELLRNNPALDGDNVYIELYEGEDYDSEAIFTWLEPESDATYRRRCEEINRLNEVKIAADKMELERRIKDNPELAKDILKELGL